MSRRESACLMVVVCALLAGPAWAADRDWIGPDMGSWHDANYWSPGSVPTLLDSAAIDNDANAWVNAAAAARALYVGDAATGGVSHVSGTLVVDANAYLGRQAGSAGTYDIAGATSVLQITDHLYAGDQGDATLSVAGGASVTVGGYACLANDAGAVSIVSVSGAPGGAASSLAVTTDLLLGSGGGTAEMAITDGGYVSARWIAIGDANGPGSSLVKVSGKSALRSTLATTSAGISIGYDGEGRLEVLDGGLVDVSYNVALAEHVTSVGSLLVSGTHADTTRSKLQITPGHGLTVGLYGDGNMVIAGGGLATCADGYIGYSGTSRGEVLVTGVTPDDVRSEWVVSNNLVVGELGRADLGIANGGIVNVAGDAYVGKNATDARVEIDGASASGLSSRLDVIGDTYIANAGGSDANVTITNGGFLRVLGDIFLANSAGARAAVTVSGEYSAVIESSIASTLGGVYVGKDGQAELSILDGGSVTGEAGGIRIGYGSDGNGSVLVSGIGAMGHVSTLATGAASDLAVGESGDGTLTATDGGLVLAKRDAFVAKVFGSAGVVTLDGDGTLWEITRSAYVGGGTSANGGVGSVAIGGGAAMVVGQQLKIWTGGEVRLLGSTLNASDVSIIGLLEIADGNMGDPDPVATLANYGVYRQTGGTANVVQFDNMPSADTYVDGGTLNAIDRLHTYSDIFQKDGTINTHTFSSATTGTYQVGGGSLNAQVIRYYGSFQVNGGTVGEADDVGLYENYGTFDANGGVTNVETFTNITVASVRDGEVNAGSFANNGTCTQTGGTMNIGLLENAYMKMFTLGGGVLNVDEFTNRGTFRETGSTLEANCVENNANFYLDNGDANVGRFCNNANYWQTGGSYTGGCFRNELNFSQDGGTFSAGTFTNGDSGNVTVEGDADFHGDEIHNQGQFYLGEDAHVSTGGATLTNYPGATFEMGDSPGGCCEDPPVCTFTGWLINYGTFRYYSGVFDGVFEQRVYSYYFQQFADFTAEGGIINRDSLANPDWMNITANGFGLRNYGYFYLQHGVLGGTVVTNETDGEIDTYGYSTIDAPVTNYGMIRTDDVLTVTGKVTNRGGGTLWLGPQERMVLDGGVDNYGVVSFQGGGTAEGGGQFNNKPSGLVLMEGGGSVLSPLTNHGEIRVDDWTPEDYCYGGEGPLENGSGSGTSYLEDLRANHGIIVIHDDCRLYVDRSDGNIPSDGDIVLLGHIARLAGERTIDNQGTITGAGLVSTPVNNTGVIRAEGIEDEEDDDTGEPLPMGMTPAATGGGAGEPFTLWMTGSPSTNGTSGRIEVAAGNTIVFTAGVATNAGTIAISGGTYDNSAQPMTNSGDITGHGTFRSGELVNSGRIGVGGGDMAITGKTVNSGTAYVYAGSTLTFFSEVNGNGVDGNGTVVFLAGFSPGFSPGIASFGGNVVFGSSGSLKMELAGDGTNDPLDPICDELNVVGNVSLNGTLDLSWLPIAGDPNSKFGGTYDLVTYRGDRFGTFRGYGGNISEAYVKDLRYDVDLGGGLWAVQVELYDLLDGDVDLSGRVDRNDFLALRGAFGGQGDWFAGDFNFDGEVDFLDYVAYKRAYGQHVPGAVPEPASVCLLAPVLLAAARRRRRRGAGLPRP